AKQGEVALALLTFGSQRVQAPAQVAHSVRCFLVLGAKRLQASERIEQLQLIGGLEEGLAFALAVDIDEEAAQLPERADGNGLLVDVGIAAAGAGQAAAENDLLLGRSGEEVRDLGAKRQVEVEAAGDAELVGACTKQVCGAAVAEQEADGFQKE